MRDLCYVNEQLLWRSLRFSLPDGVDDGTLLRAKMGFSSRCTPSPLPPDHGKIYSYRELISNRIRRHRFDHR